MKITCDARALLGALDLCAQVTPAKTTMPILKQALLQADALGTLSLTATDLVVRVRASLDATVDERLCVLVPAQRAAEWLDEVDDIGCPVELELVGEELPDQRLHWRVGPYRMRTTLLEAVTEDLPDTMLPRPDLMGAELVVDVAALASVLPSLLAVARGREDAVHVVGDGEHVTLYALGPMHAAVAVLRNHGEPQVAAGEWAIPARALPLLQAANGDRGLVHLGADERSAVAWCASHEVVARLDARARPVPEIADIATALRESGPRTENSLEVNRRDLQHLLDAGALLGGHADLVYEPRRRTLEMRSTRDDEQLKGGTRASATVLRGPPRKLAVTLDCGAVQRLVKSLSGATVCLDLDDVLGGPGLRLWPADEQPDGARVLLLMRADARAQQEADHAEAAA